MSALLCDFKEHPEMLEIATELLDAVREASPNNPEHKSRNIAFLDRIRLQIHTLGLIKSTFSPAQREEFELLYYAFECISSYRFTGLLNFLRCGLDLFIEILETGGRAAWIQAVSKKIHKA